MCVENESFADWYFRTTETAGVLMLFKTASMYMEITPQYLNRLVKNRKLKRYCYEKKSFVGMNDINKEIIRRLMKPKNRN